MSDRDRLATELSAASFAVTEAVQFLDTHPNDRAALEYLSRYAGETDRLREKYEQAYGPLFAETSGGPDCWEWTGTPWPWVVEGGRR